MLILILVFACLIYVYECLAARNLAYSLSFWLSLTLFSANVPFLSTLPFPVFRSLLILTNHIKPRMTTVPQPTLTEFIDKHRFIHFRLKPNFIYYPLLHFSLFGYDFFGFSFLVTCFCPDSSCRHHCSQCLLAISSLIKINCLFWPSFSLPHTHISIEWIFCTNHIVPFVRSLHKGVLVLLLFLIMQLLFFLFRLLIRKKTLFVSARMSDFANVSLEHSRFPV